MVDFHLTQVFVQYFYFFEGRLQLVLGLGKRYMHVVVWVVISVMFFHRYHNSR